MRGRAGAGSNVTHHHGGVLAIAGHIAALHGHLWRHKIHRGFIAFNHMDMPVAGTTR